MPLNIAQNRLHILAHKPQIPSVHQVPEGILNAVAFIAGVHIGALGQPASQSADVGEVAEASLLPWHPVGGELVGPGQIEPPLVPAQDLVGPMEVGGPHIALHGIVFSGNEIRHLRQNQRRRQEGRSPAGLLLPQFFRIDSHGQLDCRRRKYQGHIHPLPQAPAMIQHGRLHRHHRKQGVEALEPSGPVRNKQGQQRQEQHPGEVIAQ